MFFDVFYAYFRAFSTKLANGFSHVYILMTCIPEMISFIRRTLSSVLMAVFRRNIDVILPNQTKTQVLALLRTKINSIGHRTPPRTPQLEKRPAASL